MNAASAQTFFQALGKIFKFWNKYEKSDSLVRYTQTTRVEPIVMIDQRAQHLSYLPDTLQALLALFAAYYLQAAALRVNVGKINVGKFLNPLNPDRPFLESFNPALGAFGQGVEAYREFAHGLPLVASTEDEKVDILTKSGQQLAAKGAGEHKPSKGAFDIGTELNRDIKEAVNLSVGRIYSVEISDDGHKASIPVMIRLLTTLVPADLLVHILGDNARVTATSGKERWYAYKMKDLKFWRDLVFAQDLIDEHKKALLNDTGVYQNILNRQRGNAVSTAFTLEPTVGTASNMVVVTRQSIKELEAAIGGKFDNPAVRKKVFDSTYLMIVAVIDPDYDHITFYHRGIDQPSELSVRDVKMASKGAGPDIGELLKTYVMGQAPSF